MRNIILFLLIVSVSNVFGIGAITYVGDVECTIHEGSRGFQEALYEAYDSASTPHPITFIFVYGGGADDTLISDGDYFEVGPELSGIEIAGHNTPILGNGVRIDGDNVYFHSPDRSFDIGLEGTSGTGVFVLGSNVTVEGINVVNGYIGIHTDAPSTMVRYCTVDGSVIGFMGHGSTNSGEFYKIMARNCRVGVWFFSGYTASIDRATIYNFVSYGINGNGARVTCKRCLVYGPESVYEVGAYYYRVTFLNVWSDALNDNVAMGDNCHTLGKDFVGCSGVDRMSYDWYPDEDYRSNFYTSSADIVTDSTYSSGEWSAMSNHFVPKMLCHYVHSPLTSRYEFDDNVGYDTLITKKVARQIYDNSASIKPSGISITAFPNPFNSELQISLASPQLVTISIYNLQGQMVAKFTDSPSVKWRPENLPTGIYLIRAETENGGIAETKVIYLK